MYRKSIKINDMKDKQRQTIALIAFWLIMIICVVVAKVKI